MPIWFSATSSDMVYLYVYLFFFFFTSQQTANLCRHFISTDSFFCLFLQPFYPSCNFFILLPFPSGNANLGPYLAFIDKDNGRGTYTSFYQSILVLDYHGTAHFFISPFDFTADSSWRFLQDQVWVPLYYTALTTLLIFRVVLKILVPLYFSFDSNNDSS